MGRSGADVVALLVVLLAGALSATWAFLVPIFQAPDEPAHYDYAISIFSAGRLLRPNNGPIEFVVSPYTRYLLKATDFERIAWHSSMKVASGYGSAAYFRQLDENGPDLRSHLGTEGRANYIAQAYPFGFYAVEALWMRLVADFDDSLSAVFFAARLLCVMMMMSGLYFNYRTAVNLGLSRWLAVAFIGCVGLFPLTTFVSSYIQPDNLAYLLVSAAIYFASALRRGLSLRSLVGLGATLGFLVVTKYQFFLSAAIPGLALVAVKLLQARTPVTRSGLIALIVLLPTIALASVQYLTSAASAGPSAAQYSPIVHVTSSLGSGGVIAGSGAAMRIAAEGLVNCFAVGLCAATYWQVVGWFDTPIVIGTWGTEAVLRIVVSVISISVLCVVVFETGRNIGRLAEAWRRGKAKCVVLRLVSDPIFNSYIVFLATMLAIYVITDNEFGAEGRHFYPYVFAGMLCTIWYAPRAFGRRRRPIAIAAVTTVLTYCVLGSSYAIADVTSRYHGAESGRFTLGSNTASSRWKAVGLGILRPVEKADYTVETGDFPTAFDGRTSALRVSGVAAFERERLPGSHVSVVVDDKSPSAVLTELYDVSVAEGTRSEALAYSGFYSKLDTRRLTEGMHTVAAFARVPASNQYDWVPPLREFFLTGADGRFSGLFLRKLETARGVPGSTRLTTCKGALIFDDRVATVSPDSILLVTGESRTGDFDPARSAVWFVAEKRPFPGAASGERGQPLLRFRGELSAAALGPGLHDIRTFYGGDGMKHLVRVEQTIRVRVSDRILTRSYRTQPLSQCADPLRQLNGGFSVDG